MKPDLDLSDGWPPDGAAGDFLGFDAEGAPSLLRWFEGVWVGVRLMNYGGAFGGVWRPEAFRRGEETERRVVKWARLPPRQADAGASP